MISAREARERQAEMITCACGCGTEITRISFRRVRRFANGHQCGRGANHPRWKGGRGAWGDGYVFVYMPSHPKANHGYVLEHAIIAERALGKPLPEKAQVHHFNEDKADNASTNLVICENRAYHALLHQRMRVLRAGGDPNTDKICGTCKAVKPQTEFHRDRTVPIGRRSKCRACAIRRAE